MLHTHARDEDETQSELSPVFCKILLLLASRAVCYDYIYTSRILNMILASSMKVYVYYEYHLRHVYINT